MEGDGAVAAAEGEEPKDEAEKAKEEDKKAKRKEKAPKVTKPPPDYKTVKSGYVEKRGWHKIVINFQE